MFRSFKKGFTLVELLVVIGITTTIALLTLPILTTRVQQTDLEEQVKNTISQMIQWQQYAYEGNGNTAYGISFSTNQYILFKGNSLASATSQENYVLPEGLTITSITLTSGNEIVFANQSFRPNVTGTIVFNSNNQNINLTINSEGMIRYAKA